MQKNNAFAIEADNMQWIQVSDLKGWEKSTAAKQYFIKALPSNYLIDSVMLLQLAAQTKTASIRGVVKDNL